MKSMIRTSLVCLFAAASVVHAETKTIVGAARDTSVRFLPPDTSNVATNWYMAVGQNKFAQLSRVLIAFDLSAVPSGAEVSEARLLMYQTAAGGIVTNTPGVTIHVHRLLREWTASHVTSTSRTRDGSWSKPGADDAGVDRAAKATATANNIQERGIVEGFRNFIAWDVTADVREFVAGKASNHGWVLIADTESDQSPVGTVTFTSTERGPDYAPVLKITYKP